MEADLLAAALTCEPTQPDLLRRIEMLEKFCRSAGVAITGHDARIARATYQRVIEMRPQAAASSRAPTKEGKVAPFAQSGISVGGIEP